MGDDEFYDRLGDGPEMTDDFYSDTHEGDNNAKGSSNINKNSGPGNSSPRKRSNFNRNKRYNDAYGNYRGGYGPGQGYGPFGPQGPPPMGPPGQFGPMGGGPPLGWGGGPPITFWSRGPPPAMNMAPKPRDNRVLGYLRRCGVAKEHLKNLPRDMLNLIEPQYCGLCGHSFESFAISRMHYISKNHLKKMKKWVTNQDATYQRSNPKEIPMKARELYCELCDVHITSKLHAESHYSGKPHRAIVEGRKNPKNPFLLQSSMKDRLDQLIRREKKHLKASEATDQEDASELMTEAKNSTNPDLYCEICKTSVTCSEQMTMHLNGKRHLSREKQHILRMMKGPTGKKKNDGIAEQADDAGEEKDDADDEEKEDEDMDTEGDGGKDSGDYEDWVNGSGENWDETR